MIEDGGRTLFFRQAVDCTVQRLVAEGIVGPICRIGIGQRLGMIRKGMQHFGAFLIVKKCTIGYCEKPCPKFETLLNAGVNKIGLYQGVLGYVVGHHPVAAAEGKQEPAERLLLSCNKLDKPLARHGMKLSVGEFFFLGLNLMPEGFASHKIVGKESHTHSQQRYAQNNQAHGVFSIYHLLILG